jgi:hypothetical protein
MGSILLPISQMHVKLLTLALLVSAVTLSCSRVAGSERSGHVEVSSDGKWIAYKWEERRTSAVGPERATLAQAVSVCWASTETLVQTKTVRIGDWGVSKKDRSLFNETFFAFSPEGKRLAIVSPFGLLFVTLETGESQTCKLAQGYVSSLSWLGEDDVVYVEQVPQSDVRMERTVWRQGFDQLVDQRHLVYRDVSTYVGTLKTAQSEFWSPDGRYLLFQSGDGRDSVKVVLLDVSDGETTVVQESARCECASWERAAAYVFWLSRASGDKRLSAYLYDVSRRERSDLTQEWREAFGTASHYSTPHLERLWTPDNQFVVGNEMDVGGFLIRPRGWEVRLLGKALAKSASYPPAVRGQPANAVLMADLYPNEALVDYQGNMIGQLGSGGYSGWTILPDGTEAVSIHPGNSVVVAPLRQ